MAVRLQVEPWGRLPDLTRPTPPARRERNSLAWAIPYWVAALGFAYAAHADWIPVRSWLEALSTSAAGAPAVAAVGPEPEGAPPPVIGETEVRRAAMGVYTGAEADDRFEVAHTDDWEQDEWESVPADPPEDAEDDEAVADSDSEDDGHGERRAEAAEASDEPSAEASDEPAAEPSDDRRVAALDRSSADESDAETVRKKRPRRRSRSRSRRERMASMFDDATRGSSGRRRAEADEATEAPPVVRRRGRASRGKAMSCEAAIASYKEEWRIGEGSGPADLSAEHYGAVLNSGAYFRHCGVPGSMAVRICAAVQNGQAVGVTITTSPRSSKVRRCIASSVRGLGFPSHPRMDVTTTVFKAAR